MADNKYITYRTRKEIEKEEREIASKKAAKLEQKEARIIEHEKKVAARKARAEKKYIEKIEKRYNIKFSEATQEELNEILKKENKRHAKIVTIINVVSLALLPLGIILMLTTGTPTVNDIVAPVLLETGALTFVGGSIFALKYAQEKVMAEELVDSLTSEKVELNNELEEKLVVKAGANHEKGKTLEVKAKKVVRKTKDKTQEDEKTITDENDDVVSV